MMKDTLFETETVELKSEDKIVMFTDGITEAMDNNENEFGELRVKEIIKKNTKKSAEQTMDSIRSEVKNFIDNTPQSDDITMVVVKVKN